MKRQSVCISLGMHSFLRKYCTKIYIKRHIIIEKQDERSLVTEFDWEFDYESIGSIINEKNKCLHVLKKYKLKNGKCVKEFIQAKIINEEVYFIGLKYCHNGVKVKESLWTDLKIKQL